MKKDRLVDDIEAQPYYDPFTSSLSWFSIMICKQECGCVFQIDYLKNIVILLCYVVIQMPFLYAVYNKTIHKKRHLVNN